MKILKNLIYILFVLFLNQNLIKAQSLCSFNNNEDIIKYYAKGVISNYNITYPTIWDFKDYNLEFIHCINGFSQTTYIIKDNGDYFYQNSGIFIGSSIDLGKLSKEFIDSNLTSLTGDIKNRLKNISGKFGKDAEDIYNSIGNFTLSSNEITLINQAVYSYYLPEMIKYYDIDNYKKIKTNSLKMCLLTFFVKFYGLTIYLEETKHYIESDQLDYLSYFFLNVKNSNYIQNKIWSLICLGSTKFAYNYHHIGFYLDLDLNSNEEKYKENIKEWLKDFITTYQRPRTLYTLGNFSKILFDGDNNTIYNYSSMIKIIDDYIFLSNNFNEVNRKNINQGISKFEQIMILNNSLANGRYYQRHLIIITNTKNDEKIRINYFNEKGINVIFLYKISSGGDISFMERVFEDIFNRIPIYYYEDLNKNDTFSLLLNSHLNFYVEPFYYRNNIIEINKIRTIDVNNIQCFKIYYEEKYKKNNINDDNSFYYFHISLIYNDENTIKTKYNNNINITFFVSNESLYSDIYNYQFINYCLNNTVSSDFNKSPYINYKITNEDIKNDYFYITIFGNDLDYSLRIELLYSNDNDNYTISNGLFGILHVQPISSEYIATFSEKCIQKSCNVDYISLVKYFTSGIHYNMNSDIAFKKIFDLSLFDCLYKNYYCPFFNIEQKEAIYNLGPYLGYGIDLPKITEMDLLKEEIPLYIINKLHPFLFNNFNSSISKETLEKNNLILTDGELFKLNIEYLKTIFQQINRIKNFDDFSENIKFAVFLRVTELGTLSGINLEELYQGNIDKYLDNLMKSERTRTTSFESLNFQMLLIQATQIKKLKKCLLSIVVGKSLLFSEKLIELINKFSNYRISLSYYDEQRKKTILVQYFTENIDEIESRIYSITKNSSSVEKMKDNVNINSILRQQYSLFKNFDYGIKKAIIIISTHSNDTFNYDFNYPDNELLEKIDDLGINIFDYSDRINFIKNKYDNNNEKNVYNFYNSVKNEYIQYVPYLKYFDISDNYITLFNVINKYPIPINKIQDIYLDLHPNEEITFEFNLAKEIERLNKSDYLDKYNSLRFTFEPSNLDIYFSRAFPFPNIHSYELNYTFDNENEKTKILYDLKDLFQDRNSTKFYMTIKSPKKVDNLLVDIELCDVGGRGIKERFYFRFYICFISVGILIFLYGIYICFCEITFKKESNIFDIK